MTDLTSDEHDDNPYLYDDDPYDTHKDDCACGHWHSGHFGPNGACGRTTVVTDFESLPPKQYAPGEEDTPWAVPINWPPVSEWPKKTVPCPCKGFRHPEQDPFDYGY